MRKTRYDRRFVIGGQVVVAYTPHYFYGLFRKYNGLRKISCRPLTAKINFWGYFGATRSTTAFWASIWGFLLQGSYLFNGVTQLPHSLLQWFATRVPPADLILHHFRHGISLRDGFTEFLPHQFKRLH